ncbi:PIN domain-containing protein [Candidatus Pacearchaeota archaeon]|nr:PIN domain-containing protein [Candidatus Pacearchaeota archaeon]
MKYMIDSSCWIDYLEGSKSGEKINEIIKHEEVYALSINIAEIVSKIKRKRGNFELAYNSIISNAAIINITSKIAKDAGILHAEIKPKISNFSLADAFMIIAAKSISAKILTKDEHFRDFKEAVMIK